MTLVRPTEACLVDGDGRPRRKRDGSRVPAIGIEVSIGWVSPTRDMGLHVDPTRPVTRRRTFGPSAGASTHAVGRTGPLDTRFVELTHRVAYGHALHSRDRRRRARPSLQGPAPTGTPFTPGTGADGHALHSRDRRRRARPSLQGPAPRVTADAGACGHCRRRRLRAGYRTAGTTQPACGGTLLTR